ncbi:MAG TPA: diacylglycerol kinase family protein [Candidatus Binatia bacterium]|nr:diacylglycerol kinase family protein [Candidatus Binatia bacterium]
MRQAALLYNPDSGRKAARRHNQLESALSILRAAGVGANLVSTESPAHSGEQARRAVQSGCDTVFACGGDGTIHNIVQVLANTKTALAILPMGTANALAHDLALPMSVPGAARAALQAKPRRVALGRIQCAGMNGEPLSRFFVVAAGLGVDAHLFYKLATGFKRRMGMRAYYAKAWQLWFSHIMTRFRIELTVSDSKETNSADVTELLAVRIRNFGGVLRELAPGASLDRNDLRVVYCETASRMAYLLYVARGLLGVNWNIPGIQLASAERALCSYLPAEAGKEPARKIYVEADGELVGTLPAEMTVAPDALTLLVP